MGPGALPSHPCDGSFVRLPKAEAPGALQAILGVIGNAYTTTPAHIVIVALWECGDEAVIGVLDVGRCLHGYRQLRTLHKDKAIFSMLAACREALNGHPLEPLMNDDQGEG